MNAEAHDGGPGYASPEVARHQPPERFVYVASLYEGTGIDRPDFIAVVDVDPESATYGQIVNRTEMPNVGDELHHFGWNACSSACHSQLQRDTMIVPGLRSSRIHIIDVSDPRAPRIKDVIEGEEIKEKLGLSAPHTVHCMPGDIVTISMLGDADGNAPGGFAVLDARDFSIAERWERDAGGIEFMYDFWYQPRQNALVTSEWGAPNTFKDGFNPADVAVQMHIYLFLASRHPDAARSLCDALRPRMEDDRIWVYYEVAPFIPRLREVDLALRGCAVRVPERRLRGQPAGQVPYLELAELRRRLLMKEDGAAARDSLRVLLARLARDGFAAIERQPPLVYHNDLTATPPHFHWSADIGYALWLRSYVETQRRSGQSAPRAGAGR